MPQLVGLPIKPPAHTEPGAWQVLVVGHQYPVARLAHEAQVAGVVVVGVGVGVRVRVGDGVGLMQPAALETVLDEQRP